MKSYSVIAYVWNADIYCPSCAVDIVKENDDLENLESLGRPIFANDESDYLQYCGNCKKILYSNVISNEGLLECLAKMIKNHIPIFSFEDQIGKYHLKVYPKIFDIWFHIWVEENDGYENYGVLKLEHTDDKKRYTLDSIKEAIEGILPDDIDLSELDYSSLF